jgi:thiol-disulfide isomerase/thioredoxin
MPAVRTLAVVLALCAAPWRAAAKDEERALSPEEVKIVRATADDILAAVRSADTRAVVVNVWATWCIPCREEFPELVRLRERYRDRGLVVLFVSGDFDSTLDNARQFLAAQGVERTYLKQGKDEEFIDRFDPDWSGALPATFVYDGTGSLRHAIHGKTTYEALEEEVLPLLGDAPTAPPG